MSIPSDNPSDRPANRLSRRDFFLSTGSLCLLGAPLMLGASALSADDAPQAADPKAAFPDPVLGFEGVWERYLPGRGIILVDDQQLEDLAADPDREVNLSLNTNAQLTTLRKIREDAKKAGARTIVLAFDEFWKAYRTDVADQPRLLFPDSDRYIELTGRISNFRPGIKFTQPPGDRRAFRRSNRPNRALGTVSRGMARPGLGPFRHRALGAPFLEEQQRGDPPRANGGAPVRLPRKAEHLAPALLPGGGRGDHRAERPL